MCVLFMLSSRKFFNLIVNNNKIVNYQLFYVYPRSIIQDSSHGEHKFGFETVSEEEKSQKVYQVFENVAGKYDLMNDVMSIGVHRLWKDYFIQVLKPTPGTKLLDVAGGTGDIAYRFLKYLNFRHSVNSKQNKMDIRNPLDVDETSDFSEESPELIKKVSHVTVYDINTTMLHCGKEKMDNLGITKGISWIQGDAESLPFSENSFDAYTIAFGIRNVTHIEKALSEAYRVLKPGGRFLCMEFSNVSNPLIGWMYDAYSFQVIPALGQIIARDWRSYQYLVESIRLFPNQEDFKMFIEDSGFKMVHYRNLSFGIVAIHSGYKLT